MFRLVYLRPPPLDLDALPDWCQNLARPVAHRYDLGGAQSFDDLWSAGHLRCLQLAGEFAPAYPDGYREPDAAFRGWAYREVLTAIQREAARILGGGTIRSPRRTPGRTLVFARPLSDLADADGQPFPLESDSPFDIEEPGDESRTRVRDLRQLGEVLAVGRLFSDFLAGAQALAGRDYALSVAPEPDGSIRYEWADARASHRVALHADGSFEYRPRPVR